MSVYGVYTPYIIGSYGFAAVVLLFLVGWAVVRYAVARRALRQLEGDKSA